jgi:hypothetical protein
MIRNSWLKYVLLPFTVGLALVSLSVASYAQASLDDRLSAIEKSDTGAADLVSFEASCLELLKTFTKPEEAGKVYAKIAEAFGGRIARKKWAEKKGPDADHSKALLYCAKAVQYPLDVSTAAKTYQFWGYALQWTPAGPRKTPPKEYAKLRPAALTAALKGLNILLDNKVPLVSPPLPGVGLVTAFPSTPELDKKHDAEVAARAEADRLEELAMRRGVLERGIVSMCTRSPRSSDELRRIAGDILKDHKDVVDDLVARVESNINHPPAITVVPKEETK